MLTMVLHGVTSKYKPDTPAARGQKVEVEYVHTKQSMVDYSPLPFVGSF